MLDFSVTFIITIINITLLFFILKALLFKPVTKFMAERTKKVEDSIEQSEKDKAQAKILLAQYEAQIKTAEQEATAIIQNAREQARQEAEKIIADGRNLAEATHARIQKELELERGAALARFKQEAASLVVAATGRLLAREIKNEDCLSYADMLLEEAALSGETSHSSEVAGN